MSPEPQRTRLPFEPGKRKKQTKKQPNSQTSATSAPGKQESAKGGMSKEQRTIPEVVSRRMVTRMALLCGVPTGLGMATFVGSYFIVMREWFPLPHIAVVLVSMGFFGLGVLGLTYGILSASWDEKTPGSVLGWSEFTTNFGRMTEAWRASKQNSQ